MQGAPLSKALRIREAFLEITNRALRSLIEERHVLTETRKLDIGSEVKLVWYRTFRFYKRAAAEVFNLVNRYTNSATDGTLGMQGEHLVMTALARRQFLLVAEEANSYRGVTWTSSGHDLDFVFEKNGRGYGIEVKNTLGCIDVDELVAKIRLAGHIGVSPVRHDHGIPILPMDACGACWERSVEVDASGRHPKED